MNLAFRTIVLLIFMSFLFVYRSSGQTDCASKLKYAQELFESGQIEQIPSLLDSCLIEGFTKDQKIQAYRLLIQTYLFDYNRDKAEQVMTQFLHEYPEYKIQSIDPIEFRELYNSFQVKPSWGIGICAGSNMSQIIVKESYTTSSNNNINSKYPLGTFGFEAGLLFEKLFSENLQVSFGPKYKIVGFQNKEELNYGNEELVYKEHSGWLSFQAYLQYNILKRKLTPLVFGGGEFGYLIKASAEIKRTYLMSNIYPDVSSGTMDIKSLRNPMNTWVNAGIGAQYKVPHGFVKLLVGFNYSLMDYPKINLNFNDLERIFYYQYIDDNFVFNHFFATLSYSRLLYKTRKKVADGTN